MWRDYYQDTIMKSLARSSNTLHNCILIGFNLSLLASYDVRPAVRYWLADKNRRASARIVLVQNTKVVQWYGGLVEASSRALHGYAFFKQTDI